jgi:hypothetical protein
MNIYLIYQDTYYDTKIYIVAAEDVRSATNLLLKRHPDFHKYYTSVVLPIPYNNGSCILFDKDYDENEDDEIDGDDDENTE